jgi:glucan-binding YG repeat protein
VSNAIDTPSKVTATAAASLVREGITHVGRYLAEDAWAWKGLTADEANTIKAAGLQIFSIFEKGPTKVSYFTIDQAKKDAADAMQWAKNVGQPSGTAIYFTVDYDAQQKDFPAILAYFKAIKDNLKNYSIGAYGSYSVLTYLQSQNIAKYFMQTYAWSNGKHCSFNHICQYQNDKKLAGLDVDFDNLEQSEVGAWGKVQPKQELKNTVKNGWLKENNVWYYYKNGVLVKNDWAKDRKGLWYYLGAEGKMAADEWVKWKDKWYYLGSDGAMKTGWLKYKDKWYYLKADGSMATGAIEDKGKLYYLNNDGSMIADTKVNVTLKADKNGELRP